MDRWIGPTACPKVPEWPEGVVGGCGGACWPWRRRRRRLKALAVAGEASEGLVGAGTVVGRPGRRQKDCRRWPTAELWYHVDWERNDGYLSYWSIGYIYIGLDINGYPITLLQTNSYNTTISLTENKFKFSKSHQSNTKILYSKNKTKYQTFNSYIYDSNCRNSNYTRNCILDWYIQML